MGVVFDGNTLDGGDIRPIASMGNSPLHKHANAGFADYNSPVKTDEEVKRGSGETQEDGAEHTAAKVDFAVYGRGRTPQSPMDAVSPRDAGRSASPGGGSGERDKRKKTPRELIEQTSEKFMKGDTPDG